MATEDPHPDGTRAEPQLSEARRSRQPQSQANLAKRVLKWIVTLAVSLGLLAVAGWQFGWLGAAIVIVLLLQAYALVLLHRLQRDIASCNRKMKAQRRQLRAVRSLAASGSHDARTAVAGVGALRTQLRNLTVELRDRSSRVKQDRKRDYEQIQGTMNLFSLIDVKAPLPPLRGFAISPDALLIAIRDLELDRPDLVVECGSGSSTVWLALLAERMGLPTRFVALEHEDKYREQTIALVDMHGVSERVDVRRAPLVDVDAGGRIQPWYDPVAIEDLRDVDWLLVDGPPAAIHDQSRYPALPMFRSRLAKNARIIMDDADRQDELDTIRDWRLLYPDLTEERERAEKGYANLRFGDGS